MRKTETTLEFEQLANLPNLIVKKSTISIKQEQIYHRRERVNKLRLQGYTNKEIADQVGWDLRTIENDIHVIRELSRHWYENDTTTEYCESVHDSIIRCDNNMEELQIMYPEAEQIDLKLRILDKISECEIRKTNLLRETPAVQNYLRRRS